MTKTTPPSVFTTGQVTSADGTTIGYRRIGHGPAAIVLHGGMQASQEFTRFAEMLSGSFEVVVPDRRGRGMSPSRHAYHPDREVEDVRALVDATGARCVFGLSAGALVALRSAAAIPELTRVALYEPPLSVDGSVPTGWLPTFDRQVARGRLAAAVRTALTGLGLAPGLFRLPGFLVTPVLAAVVRFERTAPGEVSMRELVPTMHDEIELVRDMDGTAGRYAQVAADVLLMKGAKSPAYFGTGLDALQAALPRTHRVTFDGLGHGGPDNGGDPARVADVLEPFFQGAAAVAPRY